MQRSDARRYPQELARILVVRAVKTARKVHASSKQQRYVQLDTQGRFKEGIHLDRSLDPDRLLRGERSERRLRRREGLMAAPVTKKTISKMARRSGSGLLRPDWPDDQVDRLRDYLKQGASLVDIAAALKRTPEDVAAKLGDFQPVRLRQADTPGALRRARQA